jgi:tetratricopeptide (TPR) repeat protein
MIQPSIFKAAFSFFVAAVVLSVYLIGLHNELLFDDLRLRDTIFGNYGNLMEFKQRLLSYGSFVWIQQIFGEGWWKQRAFNLLLHGGVVGALFLLTRDLLITTKFSHSLESDPQFTSSREAALMVGVGLYAVNPMAVYAVGYLVQRSIVMATLFAVLACWLFVRGLLNQRPHWYALAFLSYLFAVLSKENAIMTAAMAVPLFIYIKRPKWKTIAIVVSTSLALVGIIAGVVLSLHGNILGRLFDEQSIQYALQLEKLSPGITARIYSLSILNEAALFFVYGTLWFFPNVLWMSVDLRPAFPTSFTYMPQLLGAIVYVALLITAIYVFFKLKNIFGLVALLLFFPLILFFTEFSTVWIQDPFVLYRSYLWAIAFPGLIAIILINFKPKTIYAIGTILTLIFGGLALERNLSLESEFTAWKDAAEKIDSQAPANAVGRYRPFLNLGVYYAGKGFYQLAYNNFSTAQKYGALGGAALFNMGGILQKQNKAKEALAALQAAESQGFDAMTSLNFQKGESQLALGQPAEALKSYTAALKLTDKKSIPEELIGFKKYIRSKRAQIALTIQEYDVAAEDYITLLQSEPDSVKYRYGLALSYIGQSKAEQSLEIFDKLIATNPSAAMYHGRAMANFKAGNKTAGLRDLDQAIALDPKNLNYKRIRLQIAAGMEMHWP